MEQKSYNLSPDEMLDDYCAGELMEAVKAKDVSAFRKAVEALTMNCFEFEEEQHENG